MIINCDMDVHVWELLAAGGPSAHLLPSARANLLSPSPLTASGMGSTVGLVGGFFRFGDLFSCELSMQRGLHILVQAMKAANLS